MVLDLTGGGKKSEMHDENQKENEKSHPQHSQRASEGNT